MNANLKAERGAILKQRFMSCKTCTKGSNPKLFFMVDAANAFNTVWTGKFFYIKSRSLPVIATFVRDCYQTLAWFFVIGAEEILWEGTIQGDLLGVAIYAMAISPLLNILIQSTEDEHTILKSGHGYNPQQTKSWLIVKLERPKKARRIFEGTDIQITVEGERHLGVVIGNAEYKQRYIHETVMRNGWMKYLYFSDIATNSAPSCIRMFHSCSISATHTNFIVQERWYGHSTPRRVAWHYCIINESSLLTPHNKRKDASPPLHGLSAAARTNLRSTLKFFLSAGVLRCSVAAGEQGRVLS